MIWQQTWLAAIYCTLLAGRAAWLERQTYKPPVITPDKGVIQ